MERIREHAVIRYTVRAEFRRTLTGLPAFRAFQEWHAQRQEGDISPADFVPVGEYWPHGRGQASATPAVVPMEPRIPADPISGRMRGTAMRHFLLQMQMSVDGFMSAEDPAVHWTVWNWGPVCPWDGPLVSRFNDTLAKVDTILLSRPMAPGYIDHWTRMSELRAGDPAFRFTRQIVAAHKRVLSRRAGEIRRPRTSVGRGPMREEVAALKQAAGGDIVCFGGVGFAGALLDAGVVDVLELYVNPRAVARGRSVFRHARSLELVDATAYECGIVVQRYQLGT